MTLPSRPDPILVVGAGAAGLMAARELARAGRRVTILEARDRLGGRIWPLAAAEFGYPAEAGAEFVHGAAPVTRALLREAGLTLAPMGGSRWDARRDGRADDAMPDDGRFRQVLAELETDMPVAQFLETYFGGREYAGLRRSITGMVEGYDAADPKRVSTFALRDEWMGDEGLEQQGRIAQGYGALIEFMAAECRRHGAAIRFDSAVTAVDVAGDGIAATCGDGSRHEARAAILTVPLPILAEIAWPPALRDVVTAAADIGYGNVVKILLRFRTRWWFAEGSPCPPDMSFLFSGERVPTWWTQHPEDHPVLTGWFAGPRTDAVADLAASELVQMGLVSLARIFGRPLDELKREIAAAHACNWGNDPFARGAYSYATPATRAAQIRLKQSAGPIFLSGEALYAGHDMGTVEAALASGAEAAQALLRSETKV